MHLRIELIPASGSGMAEGLIDAGSAPAQIKEVHSLFNRIVQCFFNFIVRGKVNISKSQADGAEAFRAMG